MYLTFNSKPQSGTINEYPKIRKIGERTADPFNIFQNTALGPDGILSQQRSLSKPGDFLLLEAAMDALCAVSACPMDLNPIGGDQITDIQIRINKR